MAWGAVAGAAIGVVGGALGGNEGGQQVQERKIDPRLEAYLYGQNGSKGLLGAVDNRYQQQLAQGGLNPYQTAGLEMQRQTLLSPQTTGVWDAQRSTGMGLLGAGAAGNPFQTGSVQRNGRVNIGAPSAVQIPQAQQNYQQPQNFASAFQPIQQSAPQAYQQQALPDIDALVQAAIAQSMAPRPWDPNIDRGTA